MNRLRLVMWLAVGSVVLTGLIIVFPSPISVFPHQSTTPADPCPRDPARAVVPQPNRFTSLAAPYSGAGPHLLHAVEVSRADGSPWTSSVPPTEFPDEWLVPAPVENNLDKVQLVVCKYFESTGQAIDTCQYHDGSARTLLSGNYSYRVYAARTAELIISFELKGGAGCPALVSAPINQATSATEVRCP